MNTQSAAIYGLALLLLAAIVTVIWLLEDVRKLHTRIIILCESNGELRKELAEFRREKKIREFVASPDLRNNRDFRATVKVVKDTNFKF